MALSGSVYTSGYTTSNGTCKVVFNWTATQSIEENTSTISWELRASGMNSGYFCNIRELRVKVDNVQIYYRSRNTVTQGFNGIKLASGTKTISHNNDGSKTISVKVEAGIYTWDINKSGSGTFTLDTIPRASSISEVSNAIIGNACDITWTPMSNTFYYKIKLSLGSWSTTTDAINPNTTSSYTYSDCTIPNEVANQLPNSTFGTMSVVLYTYANSSCSEVIGSTSSKTFTVTVPDSMIPTVDSISVIINNNDNSVIDSWGIAVAGYTKVDVTATASGSYGSTISSFTLSDGYSATINGSSLSYTSGVVTSSGEKSFGVACKDSRSRSSNKLSSDTITFYSYSKPSVSSFSVYRNRDDSTKVTVNADWTFSSVNGNNVSNATLYYKKSSESVWTTYGEISKNVDTVLDTTFEDIVSYNFKVIVTDSLLENAQEEGFISTLAVLMDFRAGGKGLGIGKISETDSLEIALDTNFFGDIYINGASLSDYIKSVVGTI